MTNMSRAGAFLAAMTFGAGLGPAPAHAHAHAETTVAVGYQQIVGPFITAIADGRLDAAAREAGYRIDWRQVSSGGDISTALASGKVPVGVIGSTGIAAAATRGGEVERFWTLDNSGKSEALVARNGSGIEKPEDLTGKKVAVPFVSTAHFRLLAGMDQVWKIDPRGVSIPNMKPPQVLAAWQRCDIDAAHVWPPVLTELLKEGAVIAGSEEIGAASVPTFNGLVAEGLHGRGPGLHGRRQLGAGRGLCRLQRRQGRLTEDPPQVAGIVKLIGADAAGAVEALNMLSFPDAAEQASETC